MQISSDNAVDVLMQKDSISNISCDKVKVKVSPLQAMKAHGGCECKGPTYS